MKKQQPAAPELRRIRRRAENQLHENQKLEVVSQPGFDSKAIVHELSVHQIELEMQNEELRRAQADAVQSRAQLQAIIGSAMDAIICINSDHKIVVFNTAAEKMFGCSAFEAVGRTVDRFVPERFRHVHAAHIHQFRATGVTNRSMSSLAPVFGLRADGEEFPIEATISHVNANSAEYFTVVIRDITERKLIEETKQKQTNALLSTLNTLRTQPNLNQFLNQVLEALCLSLVGDSAEIWQHDSDNDRLFVTLHYENKRYPALHETNLLTSLAPLSASAHPLWRHLVHTRQPYIVEQADQDLALPHHDWLQTNLVKFILLVPLLLGEEVIGFLSMHRSVAGSYRPEEFELARALARQATLAIQMNILAENGRTAAVLEERNRIAREIHDTLAQGFTGILMQLKAAEDILEDAKPEARQHVVIAKELARTSLAEARRSLHALRPAALEHSSLRAALAEAITRAKNNSGVTFELIIIGDERKLDEQVESNMLRIAQEALSNLLKHAQAKSCRFELTFNPDHVKLEVRDDGVGFGPDATRDGSHFGLQVMKERARQLGGEIQVSSSVGRGTRIKATIPISVIPSPLLEGR